MYPYSVDVCAGKMYVEAEDARLHLMLALIHEEDGDLAAACDMIQDVHVETYGALSKQGMSANIVVVDG
jgi:26S proteasome regulatory subunit N5